MTPNIENSRKVWASHKASKTDPADWIEADRGVGIERGYWAVTAELIDLRIGGLHLTRDMLEQADKAELLRIEELYSERISEMLDAGEIEAS